MRKVFAVLTGLILCSFMFSCSEDSTTVTPTPEPDQLEITTSQLPAGYTCTPYNIDLQATGGTPPYTWALATGSDALPEGLSLTADGEIMGLCNSMGDWTVTIACTDDSDETVTQEYTIAVTEPANPSLAVFFDNDASDCSAGTQAWSELNCYIFIMLEESEINCVRATEFKLRLVDSDDVDLEAGTNYIIINTTYSQYVSVTMGSLFTGTAISFNRPMYGTVPIHVATFSLMLIEDIDQLAIKFDRNIGEEGILGVATCDAGYPRVEVGGRVSAINY